MGLNLIDRRYPFAIALPSSIAQSSLTQLVSSLHIARLIVDREIHRSRDEAVVVHFTM